MTKPDTTRTIRRDQHSVIVLAIDTATRLTLVALMSSLLAGTFFIIGNYQQFTDQVQQTLLTAARATSATVIVASGGLALLSLLARRVSGRRRVTAHVIAMVCSALVAVVVLGVTTIFVVAQLPVEL